MPKAPKAKKEPQVALHKRCGTEIEKDAEEFYHCPVCKVLIHPMAHKMFVNVVPESDVERAKRIEWCGYTGKMLGYKE